jgi:uncharacterized protein YqjF (DUF2071 family)
MKTFLPHATPRREEVHPPGGRGNYITDRRRPPAPWDPVLVADWDRTLMLHYEIDPAILRPYVPFPLDLRAGKAYVSLVAFTLRGMRPYRGGKLAAWLMRPIATHGFLNVRTYVRVGNLTGIHFITEYLNNVLSLKLGPPTFGLPYRHARLNYEHTWEIGTLRGLVGDRTTGAALTYEARLPLETPFAPARAGTLTHWLMERYTAFTARGRIRRFFHVWHAPWPETAATATIHDDSLLRAHLPWFAHARYVGANFSPGVFNVGMGRPHRLPDAG